MRSQLGQLLLRIGQLTLLGTEMLSCIRKIVLALAEFGRCLIHFALQPSKLRIGFRLRRLQLCEFLPGSCQGCGGGPERRFDRIDFAFKFTMPPQHLHVFPAALFVIAVQLLELIVERHQTPINLSDLLADLSKSALGDRNITQRRFQLRTDVARAGTHRRQLVLASLDLLIEISSPGPFVLDGRFTGCDTLAVFGRLLFAFVNRLFRGFNLVVQLQTAAFQRRVFCRRLDGFVAKRCQAGLKFPNLPTQSAPIG